MEPNKENKMANVSVRDMLKAGVHFGHKLVTGRGDLSSSAS